MSKLRLICFPYAGGSAHVFRPFVQALRSMEVEAFEYPGRGRRMRDALCRDLGAVAEDAFARLSPTLHAGPFAFFGHSMGAQVAALFAARVAAEGLPTPSFMVVSGAPAPTHRRPDRAHELPDDEFVARLREMGGTPEAALASKELLDLFLPILRADFEAEEVFTWNAETRLELPIVALHGRNDRAVALPDVDAWSTIASGPFERHVFDGDHFFAFGDGMPRVIEVIESAAARFERD